MGRDSPRCRRATGVRRGRSLTSVTGETAPAGTRAVIFDCDGVLVDSEVIVIEVEAGLLTAAGFPITADEIAERYVGLSYPDMMDGLRRSFGRSVPPGLSASIQQAAIDAFPGRLEPVQGMRRFLEDLDRPRCVASSSALDRVRLSLRLTGLDRFFDPSHIFSAEMVSNGKPAPDLFLMAADRLGVKPENCVVIEDSPHGVTAALAAGMDVIGFVAGRHARPSLVDRLAAAGATTIVDSPDLFPADLQPSR